MDKKLIRQSEVEWSKHRLRVVFDKWVLKGIFGHNRDKAIAEHRKLHNEELQNLYPSPNIVRMDQIEVFWVVMPCSVADGYQCFGGPCCLHLYRVTFKCKND
jgi:hypothetical protein